MGVIKNFAYGRTPPILRSSEESLSSAGLSVPSTPPSETEELQTNQSNSGFNPRRRDPALLIQRLEYISRKRTGARKARREDNARALQTLVESDEERISYSPTIRDFIPNSESPLTRLMTDFNCMRIWQYFLAQSEEEQRKYLNDVAEKRRTKRDSLNLGIHFTRAAMDGTGSEDTHEDKKDEKKSKAPSFSPEQRFSLIDSSLRTVLKQRHIPLGILSFLEKDIVGVFHEDNSAVYVSQELNSFERLLLHGICQYHLLKSWSMDVAGSRRTKVENKYSLFSYPKMTLTEFLERRNRLLTSRSK